MKKNVNNTFKKHIIIYVLRVLIRPSFIYHGNIIFKWSNNNIWLYNTLEWPLTNFVLKRTYDPKYIVCEGRNCLHFMITIYNRTLLFTLCLYVWIYGVHVAVCVSLWRNVQQIHFSSMVSFLCVGVNESPLPMVSLQSCVLSEMFQQQFRLNLSCRGSAWKYRWASDTSARVPKAPGIYQRAAEVDSI